MPNSDIEKMVNLVEQGVRYKEKYGNSKRWHTYREYGRGKFPGYVSTANGILPYNLVHSMQRGLVPNIYFRNPYINVTSRFKTRINPLTHIQSKVVEAADNWLMQELGLKQTFKTMVMDGYYTDRGIAKIGYDSLYGGSQTATPSFHHHHN